MREKWKETQAERIGDDLQVLVQQLGSKISAVEELTRLTSVRQRKASFKLTLKDGRQFKARRFKTIDDWLSVLTLSPLLEDLHFSSIIAAHGLATIEEWIAGSPLAIKDVTERQTQWAGALLGRLHSITEMPAELLARTLQTAAYTLTDALNQAL